MRRLGHPPGRKPLVLIAGGGIGAVETLLALRDRAGHRIDIHVISASPYFSYAPLAVEEPFGGGPAPRFDLRAICVDQDAGFTHHTLLSVDPERHHVLSTTQEMIGYDALVVAVGASRHSWLHQAATLFGPGYASGVRDLLADAEQGVITSAAFIVPANEVWSLPVYELALMAAAWAARRDVSLSVGVFTPESEPVAAFGGAASLAVGELLASRGIDLHLSSDVLREDWTSAADRLVTLPALTGPKIRGLPTDESDFILVDQSSRVSGCEDIYAVGDATTVRVKQGGVAAQQADIAAGQIAYRAGAGTEPSSVVPTLRGILLTGEEPLYLRAQYGVESAEWARAARHPLWWPPAKVAAPYVSEYLFERGGGPQPLQDSASSTTAS